MNGSLEKTLCMRICLTSKPGHIFPVKKRKYMNEYYYNCYRYIIRTDFDIPFLRQTAKSIPDIQITGSETKQVNKKTGISVKNDILHIIFPFITFDIELTKGIMRAAYVDIEQLYSTMFNLPFSAIAISRGDILLHCGSVSHNNYIFAFAGEKGIGKSTLISRLSKTFNFFTDDTLDIKDNNYLHCYSCGSFMKLHLDSFLSIKDSDMSLFDNARKNIQNKAYLTPFPAETEQAAETRCLKRIYLVKREKINKPVIDDITGSLRKRYVVIANTVGSGFLPKELLQKMARSSVVDRLINLIEYKQIIIPDNIDSVTETAQLLVEDIRLV
jgi:hypothetical protein